MISLSAREGEVLTVMCDRRMFTEAEIGSMLYLSPHTVHTHIRHLREKIGHNDRRSLVRAALDSGLVR